MDEAFHSKLGQISNYSSKSIFICQLVRDVRNHLFHWFSEWVMNVPRIPSATMAPTERLLLGR